MHTMYSIYDLPVKTPQFSKVKNNAQKFAYRMAIIGSCAASFGYKSVIFFTQFDSKPEAAALLTGKSYICVYNQHVAEKPRGMTAYIFLIFG